MQLFNVTIIGAGVIGLAIAEGLSAEHHNVLVLEKNTSFGQETSSRNSEVIHAGIYYPTGLLKSTLCVEGSHLLYKHCKKRQIPHRKTGKLIVATSDEECAQLEAIRKQAEQNGVEDLTLIGNKQVRILEPEVRAKAALFSPSTGIIDTHGLIRSFYLQAEENGATISFRTEVTAIHRDGTHYDLEINDGAYHVQTRTLINSAGLHADRIAALAGIDINEADYRLKFCKGNYFSASPSPKINHLVYPVPAKNNESLGIHATLALDGRVRFGPDSRYLDAAEISSRSLRGAQQRGNFPSEPFDYTVDENHKASFYEAITRYLPRITMDQLHPDMSGIRPKLQGPGEPYRDFVIREESDRGFPGMINLIGIESPGITSCLAIQNKVQNILE
jgi:L-2-hydroxyglutarate oxidase LhgO